MPEADHQPVASSPGSADVKPTEEAVVRGSALQDQLTVLAGMRADDERVMAIRALLKRHSIRSGLSVRHGEADIVVRYRDLEEAESLVKGDARMAGLVQEMVPVARIQKGDGQETALLDALRQRGTTWTIKPDQGHWIVLVPVVDCSNVREMMQADEDLHDLSYVEVYLVRMALNDSRIDDLLSELSAAGILYTLQLKQGDAEVHVSAANVGAARKIAAAAE